MGAGLYPRDSGDLADGLLAGDPGAETVLSLGEGGRM